MQKKTVYLKFFLSGIALSVPYVLPKLWIVAYVALIPMIRILILMGEDATKKRAYLSGLCFGMGYFGVMFHWFMEFYPMEFAEVTKPMAVLLIALCWLGLATLQALEFGFLPLVYRLIRPKKETPLLGAFVFGALFVIFEWQQNFFFRGVPWARLGITQVENPLALQSASLFGGQFVSLVIVMVNAFIALASIYATQKLNGGGIKAIAGAIKNKKTAIYASVALGIFLVNILFGGVRMLTYKDEGDAVTVAVIQANQSSLDNLGTTSAKALNMYLELTEQCVKESGAKIVVWPETAVPSTISRYPTVMKKISEKTAELDITLFAGAFDYDNDGGAYNSIYLFKPDGTVSDQRYHKRHLVPFGEYTPFEGFVKTVLPTFYAAFNYDDSLTAGKGSQLFETKYGLVGSLICFDSIYDELTRESVNDGAGLITLSTNDSWFSDSPAVYQHSSHAVLRAIENGRYVLRAATTGVSCIISPTGQILDEQAPLTQGYAVAEVYINSGRTLYSYVGNVVSYLALGFAVCMLSRSISLSAMAKKKEENIE